MGLFDIFKFKKDIKGVFSSENISDILMYVREKIVEQAKKNIPGSEKKAAVDYLVIQYIRKKVANCNNNIVLWLVERIVEVIPKITQIIYDFLKEKIENL